MSDIIIANPEKINVTVGDDVTILKKKGDTIREYNSEIKLDDIHLPIKKGDVIGKLFVCTEWTFVRKCIYVL